MSMFGPNVGTWWLESKSDPRWDMTGRSEGVAVAGMTAECKKWFELCKSMYGDPPFDCSYGFMKD